jgi:hypothetical protein
MKFEKQDFSNQQINLDDNEFSECTFTNCNCVFQGTGIVTLTNCSFSSSLFTFSGPAANTITFMTNMYSGGFKDLIEGTFNSIRNNVKGASLKLGYS